MPSDSMAMPGDPPPLEIAPFELARLRGRPGGCAILDVREPWEIAICALPEGVQVPLDRLVERAESLPRDRMLVVVCHAGVRSLIAAQHLRASGFDRVTSLRGGLDAWALEIDPDMPRY